MSSFISDYSNSSYVEGVIKYEDDWMLLHINQEIQNSEIEKFNLDLKVNKKPHISVIKSELPCINNDDWSGKKFQDTIVKFKCSSKYETNGLHVWTDCYSEDLCRIREHFGLPTLKHNDVYMVNFHFTLGKLKRSVDKIVRDQYRLTERTHIDCETLMQHI